MRIARASERLRAYPHELSGGMCQRVLIAMALAAEPSLLIADEPTTGLDVTTQKVIMDTLYELGASRGLATLLITHDVGLAARYCRRICRDERRPHRGDRPDRARDRAAEGAVHTTPHGGDAACRTRARGFAAASGIVRPRSPTRGTGKLRKTPRRFSR